MSRRSLLRRLRAGFFPGLAAVATVAAWSVAAPGPARAQAETVTEASIDAPAESAGTPRIVAIGDIHGAREALVEILVRAGLVDDEARWIGGKDVLVQTGDFLDRGADALDVAELLRRLQEESARAGGRVVVLLGNHEVLNLTLDLRDVTPDIVRPFADRRSAKRRDRYCDRVLRREQEQNRQAGRKTEPRRTRMALCRGQVPEGLLEYLEALGPDEPLGQWLRQLPTVARVGDWLFVHGGISPKYADLSVEELNRRTWDEIALFDRVRRHLVERELVQEASQLTEIVGVARALAVAAKEHRPDLRGPSVEDLEAFSSLASWNLFDPDGPLWFRGYARWNDEELGAALPEILASQDAAGIAVGHTPRKSRSIEIRADGQVVLIDTGMLSEVYGGRASALEIVDGNLTAVYPESRDLLEPENP